MTDHANSVSAFWCRSPSRPNFGDALTPWLIERVTGTHPRFREPGDPCHKYFVTGSVVSLAQPPCTVWGSGIMSANDVICPGVELAAVRGPLTRHRALACDVQCPEIYGDPAMLLPTFYRPADAERRGIGLALHYSDFARFGGQPPPKINRVIDLQQPIDVVVNELTRCELVATSSLHALITSHAYGVPATWIEFQPLPSGDGSKFRDYLLSIGCPVDSPLQVVNGKLNPELLWKESIAPPRTPSIEELWNACPFRRDK